jgi:hypothetical protein
MSKGQAGAQGSPITIPAQADWVDHGLIFTHGAAGQWDNILWGGFAGCITKKDGLFHLYYQGSDGYDEVEGSVSHRAIGLAISSDGLNFQKHPGNPVLTYSPNNNIEEGAVSCGVSMDGGEMVMYYGANKSTRATSSSINANGMVATSPDGYSFSDQGVALSYADPNLWGSGDEVFPVMSLKAPETNQWLVYYIPNGVSQSRLLGIAWGNSRLGLTNSAGVTEPDGDNISTWGMGGGVVGLQDGTYAVFTNDVSTQTMTARIMNPNTPYALSEPVQSYNFADFSSGVVYFDTATNTWYLYYRNADASAYGVKTAGGANEPVNQPPSISAGQDTTVVVQNGTASVTLVGSATDDGLPDPPNTTSATWSQLSGPGPIIFADTSNLNSTVTMTAEGTYSLELSVSDGELTTTDTVAITVQAEVADPACQLSAANWGRENARDHQKVHLNVFSNSCNGETVHFDIYEVMAGSQEPLLVESKTTTISNNQAKSAWNANYNCDESGISCPAPGGVAYYYFEAYLVANPNQSITSPTLSVTP